MQLNYGECDGFVICRVKEASVFKANIIEYTLRFFLLSLYSSFLNYKATIKREPG